MKSEPERTLIPKQPGSQYTNEQRMTVLADYFVTGNITKTADIHNIPRTTVDGWIKSEWGVELLVKIRHENGEQLDARLTKLINSAFEQAQDRVENGDYRLSKDGEIKRIRLHRIDAPSNYGQPNSPFSVGSELSMSASLPNPEKTLSPDFASMKSTVFM